MFFESFFFKNFKKKSILVKISKIFDSGQIFRKFWIFVKFSKIFDFSKISEKLRFKSNFRKNSNLVKKIRKTSILVKFSENFYF